jgi:FMN phosphatase YigB (HAD superfamily)
MREADGHNALLVDFGGVLTTSVWDSFADFCREKDLDEDTVKRLFREDPGALADLRGLETGELEEAEFEKRFADRLGLDDATDLIEGMFRGMLPCEPVVAAVRAVGDRGFKTGLISNSWSTSHYDRSLLRSSRKIPQARTERAARCSRWCWRWAALQCSRRAP